MPEDERRELAPHLLAMRREADGLDAPLDMSRVWLAIYATATLSEIRKLRWWSTNSHACAILADRNVPWLQDWAETALDAVRLNIRNR